MNVLFSGAVLAPQVWFKKEKEKKLSMTEREMQICQTEVKLISQNLGHLNMWWMNGVNGNNNIAFFFFIKKKKRGGILSGS